MNIPLNPNNDSPWESGELGQSMEHAMRAPDFVEAEIDRALGLEVIKLRLSKELIADFQRISEINGIIPQALMRDALFAYAYNFKNGE